MNNQIFKRFPRRFYEVSDTYYLDRQDGTIVDQHNGLVYESFALNDANVNLKGRVRLAQLTNEDKNWEEASAILKFEGFMEPLDYLLVRAKKELFCDLGGPDEGELGELYEFAEDGYCHVRFLYRISNEQKILPEYFCSVVKIEDLELLEDFS